MSLGAPNSCSETSPKLSALNFVRSSAMLGAGSMRTSIKMPPLKSMPKLSPWTAKERTETTNRTIERPSDSRRLPMKSILVSGGTILSHFQAIRVSP